MSDKALAIEQALTMLAATPTRIAELTSGLSAAQLRKGPEADEWSVNDVLAHLRACADVRGGHIQAMLDEDKPTLRTLSPRTWIHRTNYPDLEFAASFRAFKKQRSELLRLLEALPRKSWARSARMVGSGKPVDHDVLFYADWLVQHERPHIKQIAQVAEAIRAS